MVVPVDELLEWDLHLRFVANGVQDPPDVVEIVALIIKDIVGELSLVPFHNVADAVNKTACDFLVPIGEDFRGGRVVIVHSCTRRAVSEPVAGAVVVRLTHDDDDDDDVPQKSSRASFAECVLVSDICAWE